MAIIERFHLIYFYLLLIFLSKNINIVNSEVFKGNSFNFFNIISNETAKNIIITNYKQNKVIFSEKNNIQIDFSNSSMYDAYIYQIKKDLYEKKFDYHFFLISSKSLFNKYSRFKDWEFDFTKENEEYSVLNKKSLHDFLLPLNKYIDDYQNITSDSLYDEYKLNDELYGLPFSATYDYLFYNRKLLNKYNITLPEGTVSWTDIENITLQYRERKTNSTTCGLVVSLNTDDDMISLFLEGLFSTSYDNGFKDCKEYKEFNSNYRKCGKKYPEFFYGDTAVEWLATMKRLFDSNIICKDSLDIRENEALNKFRNGEALFFKGRTDSSHSIYKSEKSGNKNNYSFIKLPNNFTSYQSVAIVGNGSNKLKNKFKDIAEVIKLLGDFGNQINRMKSNYFDTNNVSMKYNYEIPEDEKGSIPLAFTPVFSYSKFHSLKNDSLPVELPYRENLIGIKPISLATAMSNPESTSTYKLYKRLNEDIRFFLKGEEVPIKIYDGLNATWTVQIVDIPFKSNYTKESREYKNLKTLTAHLYYYLNIPHTKWLSGVGIMNIVYMIVGNVYAFSLIGLILYNKNKNKMIKKAYPKLCITFIICISFNFDYALFHNGLPIKFICALEHNFMHIFTSVALLITLKRLWNILIIIKDSKTKFLNLKITRFTINTIIAVVLTFEIVMNLLWDMVSTRVPEVTELDNGRRIAACSSMYDMHFSIILMILIIILFIFVVILTYKIKRTHDYYDEYKAYMTTSVILIIGGIITGILSGFFFVINFNYDAFEIVRSSFSFFLGMLVISLIVLPKIVDALTGKSIFSKVYKSKGKYASSNSSFNKMLFNSSNMNVITFKDAEEEYKQKLFSEELVTPLDSGYKNRKPKNNSNHSSNNNNNNNNYIGSPILENNIFSNSPSKEKDGSYLYGGGRYDDIEPRLH